MLGCLTKQASLVKHRRQRARCLAAPELLAETPRERGFSFVPLAR